MAEKAARSRVITVSSGVGGHIMFTAHSIRNSCGSASNTWTSEPAGRFIATLRATGPFKAHAVLLKMAGNVISAESRDVH